MHKNLVWNTRLAWWWRKQREQVFRFTPENHAELISIFFNLPSKSWSFVSFFSTLPRDDNKEDIFVHQVGCSISVPVKIFCELTCEVLHVVVPYFVVLLRKKNFRYDLWWVRTILWISFVWVRTILKRPPPLAPLAVFTARTCIVHNSLSSHWSGFILF